MSVRLDDKETAEMFHRWCLGNESAIEMLYLFCQLAREVDDLIDEDNDKRKSVSHILDLSLIHLGNNAFFKGHSNTLSSVVLEMIVYWLLGDEFKQDKDERKAMFGFVYRESTDRLPVVVAGILGGPLHALQVAKEVYEFTQAGSKETLAQWMKESSHGDVCRTTSS